MPGIAAALPFNDTVGETIPPDTPHVSATAQDTRTTTVSDRVHRLFFIHKSIDKLAEVIVQLHGSPDVDKAMLFPSLGCATRCVDFLAKYNPTATPSSIRTLNFVHHADSCVSPDSQRVLPRMSAVLYPKDLWPTAKIFWQHTGEGISSRRAEFCQKALENRTMVEQSSLRSSPPRLSKGPRRYQRPMSVDQTATSQKDQGHDDELIVNGVGVQDSFQFVEERFGRNLNVDYVAKAKLAVRKRIAGSLTTSTELPEALDEPADSSKERTRDVPAFSVDDVYLFSCGMNAIFTAHRMLRLARGEFKSVMYGFPYVDTLKVLEKFGAGVIFYGHANAAELDDLQRHLESGERILALFCEFPGNPLLKTPDLKRIRALADKYDFAVMVDETIGNFLNIHVLPLADIIVSSLTKIFSGDCNVMGGSMVLNPQSRYYGRLKAQLETEFEDNQFEEDVLYLERNSRDFVSRILRINHNAEAIADILRAHPAVKQVNYPKYSDTKDFYDACRLPDGGYGGLLSATFHCMDDAQVFYDHLKTQKGPSLGTNFTLSSPFVILAHYTELDWAAEFGCDATLVRFSVGLEEPQVLKEVFEFALAAI
nr:cystathionine gamma-synthase [Quercus suber]